VHCVQPKAHKVASQEASDVVGRRSWGGRRDCGARQSWGKRREVFDRRHGIAEVQEVTFQAQALLLLRRWLAPINQVPEQVIHNFVEQHTS
jgi:hypothetical protein